MTTRNQSPLSIQKTTVRSGVRAGTTMWHGTIYLTE